MYGSSVPRGRGRGRGRTPRHVASFNWRSHENQPLSSERQTSLARGSSGRSSSTHSSGSVQSRDHERVPGRIRGSNWQNPTVQSLSSSQDPGIQTGGSSERSSSTETVKGHRPDADIGEGEEFKSGQVEQQHGPVQSGHQEGGSTPAGTSQPAGDASASVIPSGTDAAHPLSHLDARAPDFTPNNPPTQAISLPPPPRTAMFPALFNPHLPGHVDRVDQLRQKYPRDLDQELDEDDAMWDDINHDINRVRESNEELALTKLHFADLDRDLRQRFAEGRRK